MVVIRKISKDKYILAAIFTALLFILGVTLGMLIDNQRIRWLEQSSKEQEIEIKSLQFQYQYLTTVEDDSNSCPVLQATLKKTVNDLSESLQLFEDFKESTRINSKEYELVGRRYLIDNMNYWLFAKKARKICGLDVVSVLYFYTKDCEICPNQGVVLTYFKRIFGDKLLVFPIDTSLTKSEPIMELLVSRYNVTKYPTLIIEEEKHEGIMQQNELKPIICSYFKNETAC